MPLVYVRGNTIKYLRVPEEARACLPRRRAQLAKRETLSAFSRARLGLSPLAHLSLTCRAGA